MQNKCKTAHATPSFPGRLKKNTRMAIQIGLYIIGLFLINACSLTYVINSPTPLAKESFSPDKRVGIAIFGKAAPDLGRIVAGQINEFAERDLTYGEITSGVTLNQELTAIDSMDELTGRYPDMLYALIVWQHPPEILNNSTTYTESNPSTPAQPARTITRYTTTFKVKCETLLFDLQQKTLIAKAVDTFSSCATNEDRKTGPIFSENTFLRDVENVLGLFSSSNNASYPNIRSLGPEAFWDYFKRFLKNIGKKEYEPKKADPAQDLPDK